MDSELINTTFLGYDVVLTYWKIFGLVGVSMFSLRWLVQAYYSRQAGKPVTPRIFWIISMVGSAMTLSYFLFSPKPDMVGIMGNGFPCIIAAYNLYLDITHQQRTEAAQQLANSSGEFTATAATTSRPQQSAVPTEVFPKPAVK